MTRTRTPRLVALATVLSAIAVAAAPALPAPGAEPSMVIYPPQAIPLTFSHARHLGAGETCASCHVRASTSRSSVDRLIPGEKVCARCHAIDRSQAKTSTACATCHPGFVPGEATARVEIPIPNLKFSHQAHAARGIGCRRCHGRVAAGGLATRADLPAMAQCLGCHDGRTARDNCSLCHLAAGGGRLVTTFASGELIPESGTFGTAHTALFAVSHENAAHTAGKTCQSCHAQSFCTDCHNGSMRAMRFHPPGYLGQHGQLARQGTTDCTACHRLQTFCVGCHSRSGVVDDGRSSSAFSAPGIAGRRRFHPPGWVAETVTGGGHGIAARRNINTCASCHREEHCTRCHSAQPGAPRANPHPPGWANSRRCRALLSRNKRVCLRCHTAIAELSCAWHGP